MHEYVQKSTSTTLPRREASDSGRSPGVFSQWEMPGELAARRRGRAGSALATRLGGGGERVPAAAERVRAASWRRACPRCASAARSSSRRARSGRCWSTLKTIATARQRDETPIARRRFSPPRAQALRELAGRRARSAASARPPRASRRASAARVSRLNRCCAESTVIVASTGPAHGTNTRPRLTPSTKPPPRSPPRRRVMNAKRPLEADPELRPEQCRRDTNSSAIATLRRRSCGSPSAESIEPPPSA